MLFYLSKILFINNPNYDTQIYNSVDYNKWMKRLDTELNEPINQIYTDMSVMGIE